MVLAAMANGWDFGIAVCTLLGVVINTWRITKMRRDLTVPSASSPGEALERMLSKTAGTSAATTRLLRKHGENELADQIENGGVH